MDSENPTPTGEDANVILINELELLDRKVTDKASKFYEITKGISVHTTSPIEVVSTIIPKICKPNALYTRNVLKKFP
ncbi:hypothetical protein RclHR1_14980004 [Rhizophagus clarus]|uniref:Uncharacterized protein n=1 Tax=Rhizophagus clarus TaxID=94130 RepID=A0A2Z6QRE9_9GLOM|nr:hypothetical protein RclHR1_14980004 [Rhizophagus clarus]GES93339.1 hypothetical protein GLOIN_2v1773955 [Rhizophagus clarus]